MAVTSGSTISMLIGQGGKACVYGGSSGTALGGGGTTLVHTCYSCSIVRFVTDYINDTIIILGYGYIPDIRGCPGGGGGRTAILSGSLDSIVAGGGGGGGSNPPGVSANHGMYNVLIESWMNTIMILFFVGGGGGGGLAAGGGSDPCVGQGGTTSAGGTGGTNSGAGSLGTGGYGGGGGGGGGGMIQAYKLIKCFTLLINSIII